MMIKLQSRLQLLWMVQLQFKVGICFFYQVTKKGCRSAGHSTRIETRQLALKHMKSDRFKGKAPEETLSGFILFHFQALAAAIACHWGQSSEI